MNRRVLVLVLSVSLLVAPAPAQAVTPEGPQLTVLADTPRVEPQLDILTMGPAGESPQTMIRNAGSSRPSWSADGSLLTFGTNRELSGEVVAIADANGPTRVFKRARLEGNPVMAPDGRTVAYPYEGSVWLLDVASGSVRRALPARSFEGLEPSSFSPDGSKLAGTVGWLWGNSVAVDLRTGNVSILAREASEPVYSPDGSEVVFVRWKNWRRNGVDDGKPPIDEVRVTRVGTFPRSRLLLRSHKLLLSPNWDPSGQRLAFIRTRVVENGYDDPKKGDALMEINADGTCLKKVYTDRETTLYGSVWQPGPGREAGPISC